MDAPLGVHVEEDGVRFSVWSGSAEKVWVCLFEQKTGLTEEVARLELVESGEGVRSLLVPGLREGALYGFRADGGYDPDNGWFFDPHKLLMDPYAIEIDRPYRFDPMLAAPRERQCDTAALMPKGVVRKPPVVPLEAPTFDAGGLIYEINVRGFTKLHPEVPESQRGTIAALAHPAVIDHLRKLRVGAIELMPITAWMDERHLPPLGLRNAWGYNPVSFMALDPRLAPGGWNELRETVAALHRAGIGVILDLVFNHTAESDRLGPTLSLRGLDSSAYYRHDAGGGLVNDTGTGNTVACDHPAARALILDALRTFVRYAGVDGFRFDLATILGRDAAGFDPRSRLLTDMVSDARIGSRVLIAEPWDIGPGGYALGRFPAQFLEWNDRFRDDVRRFWRGDAGMVASLATRLAGSSDVFEGPHTRSVNFIAAHDGMTMADLVAYERKHNLANGEDNRDGHDDNLSWNHGAEGPSADERTVQSRRASLRALLATLFVSRGAIMLTAGDEFGRTQRGNNNAYAQDNELTWLDWNGRDREMEAFVQKLALVRQKFAALRGTGFLNDDDVAWLREDSQPMTLGDWHDPSRRELVMVLDGVRIEIRPEGIAVFDTEKEHYDIRP